MESFLIVTAAITDTTDTEIDEFIETRGPSLTGLNWLYLVGRSTTDFTGSSLQHLHRLPNLSRLGLRMLSANQEQLRHLEALPKLSRITIGDSRGDPDLGAHFIDTCTRLTQLQEIGINAAPMSGVQLTPLRSLTSLKFMTLNSIELTDTMVHQLSDLSRLETLSLRSPNLTDSIWSSLAALTHLTSLGVFLGESVTGAGISSLQSLSELRNLQLTGTGVGDASMPEVNQLPSLAYLDLSSTSVTDIGLAHLQTMNLERLNLRDTAVTEDGVNRFREAQPTCTVETNFGIFTST